MTLFGPCVEHSMEGTGGGELSLLRPGAGGARGVQNDGPNPAEASRGSAEFRSGAPANDKRSEEPTGAGVRFG